MHGQCLLAELGVVQGDHRAGRLEESLVAAGEVETQIGKGKGEAGSIRAIGAMLTGC